jgi:acetate---CoA ligase (ADP-forming)
VYTKTRSVVYFCMPESTYHNTNQALPERALQVQAAKRALAPSSVVIVGASADPRSLGGFVQSNLARSGYSGALHLVSRSSTQINGLPCVSSIDLLPNDIDVAVLAIPEAGVGQALQDLGKKRLGVGIVYASGFGETGDEGKRKQDALVQLCDQHQVALLGPNCMGLTQYQFGVALTFEPIEAYPCNGRLGIGIIAQSGAMAANMRDAFIGRGLPITASVSTGNEASLGVEDFFAALLDDGQTQVIVLYIEQVRRPQLFLSLCQRARMAGKPVVLMMPGRSARARAAAQSHTGALAGDHAIASALLAREAVVVVDSFDALFDVSSVLLRFPMPPSQGTAVLTGSGALKNIALDLADTVPLDLPTFGPHTVSALSGLLPSYAVPENPLDYTTISMRDPAVVGKLINSVLADENVGSVMLCLMAGPVIAQRDKTEHILPTIAAAKKPFALVVLGDNLALEDFFSEAIYASGVPFFRSPDRAMRCLGIVSGYGRALQCAARADALPGLLKKAVQDHALPAGVWTEIDSKRWLAPLGLPIPAGQLVGTLEQAKVAAKTLGFPLVMKAQAASLPHKSDVGGVILGIASEAELEAAWSKMHASLRLHRADLFVANGLQGFLLEAQGLKGLELVLGAKRDPQWGAVLLVGLGGVWIEALNDVRLMSPGLALEDIVAQLKQLRTAALLDGVRGMGPINYLALAQLVQMLGQVMQDNPTIQEIDLNPVIAYQHRLADLAQGEPKVMALDALVVCGPNQ